MWCVSYKNSGGSYDRFGHIFALLVNQLHQLQGQGLSLIDQVINKSIIFHAI